MEAYVLKRSGCGYIQTYLYIIIHIAHRQHNREQTFSQHRDNFQLFGNVSYPKQEIKTLCWAAPAIGREGDRERKGIHLYKFYNYYYMHVVSVSWLQARRRRLSCLQLSKLILAAV